MNPIRSLLPLLAVGAVLASGCYYSDCPVQYGARYRAEGYVKVDTPPPELHARVETRPDKPSADAVWVPGHYDWRDRWIWVDGHWETPRPGHVWTPPVARHTPDGEIEYRPGHFRPRDRRPPPAYRRPGDVRVSVETPSAATDVRAEGRTRVDGTVDVRRPSEDSSRPEPRPTPSGTLRGGTVETRRPEPEPVEVTPGDVRGPQPETARPRSGDVRGPEPERVRPTPSGSVRGETPGQVRLGCQLTMSRAPRRGYVTIRGTGFRPSAVVRIGSTIAPVVSTDRETIRFQVPERTGGGTVTVSVGDQSASCGHLSVTGR